ncbi:hypothetical protein HIM_08417 [Hirsutella minnesotensis 3608]|uniref:Iron-sulfur cluster assembly factor IBA57 homolog, mitochondrial n=1 Tax=Hirsutella minnesotensis 3608 TaxID=1043627 RepID=A0A0F7ZYA9_9HYPO|nr:hypothetical protein HIM_08417 [Hirsutella minnesotensis 3608]
MRSSAKRALLPGLRNPKTLCAANLQARRSFASSLAPPPPPPPPSGLAALPSRRLVYVSGPHAARFLQGIVTANMLDSTGQSRTDSFYNGFLNAKGRVVHDTFVYPVSGGLGGLGQDQGFLIEVDASQCANFARHLRRYRLKAKVDVRELPPDQATVWQAWNEPTTMVPESGESQIVLQDPRAPGMGYRILRLDDKSPEIDVEQSNENAYTIRRYLRGVPEGRDELIAENALPLESNMDIMNGIDFHKGCYVGQELTIRTKHLGVVRKRILPCMVYGHTEPIPDTLTYKPGIDGSNGLTVDLVPGGTGIGRSGKKGRSAGKWLKGVGNIGLALCRLEIMTDVVLPGEHAAETYKEGDEFTLDWANKDGERVKVKPFVPDWLRQGLSATH